MKKIRILGQANIEMTFSMIVIVLLFLAMVRVFFWVGQDLAARRQAHERTLSEGSPGGDVNENYKQIRPTFYEGTPMDAATVSSSIFGDNRLNYP